jgi:hypothetical protein
MAELNKQDVVNDQYYISTTASLSGEGKYLSTVFGYRNKTIMWSKVYKQVYYNSLKEAEEGHKELKKQYS